MKDLNVTMRGEPTGDIVTGTNYYRIFQDGSTDDLDSVTINSSSAKETVSIYVASGNGVASGTKNRPCFIRAMNGSAKVGADSEL